jgi:signal peptidase II
MRRPSTATGAPRWWRWLWISAGVIAADQLTKAAILATIREGDGRAVTPFFSLVLTFNTGAAFSFLAEASGWQRWAFVAIAVVATMVILALLKRGGTVCYNAGLALILGGALGNLYDRLALGKVVDFLLFHYGGWAYPAFNVADSAITVGAALLILDELLRVRRGR